MSSATCFTILIIMLVLSVIGLIGSVIVFAVINCSLQEPHDECAHGCAHEYSKWEDVGDPKKFLLDYAYYGEWVIYQKRKRVCSKCNHINCKEFKVS